MATITNNDIAKAIYLGTKDLKGDALHVAMKNTVAFLARKNLLSKQKDILARLQRIVNEERGALEVSVWSKDKLSDKTKHEIKHILTERYGDKELILEEHIDESLLGGFKLGIKDEMIDLTLKTKIKNLQKHLINDHE